MLTIFYTLRAETFAARNFCGQKLLRISPTAKLLYFAGINFRGWPILRYFAGEEKMKVIFFIIRIFSVNLYNSANKVHGKSNN